MEGWICPTCKRGVAPSEKHCDHGGMQHVGLPSMPLTPCDPIPDYLRPPYKITCCDVFEGDNTFRGAN